MGRRAPSRAIVGDELFDRQVWTKALFDPLIDGVPDGRGGQSPVDGTAGAGRVKTLMRSRLRRGRNGTGAPTSVSGLPEPRCPVYFFFVALTVHLQVVVAASE